MATLSKSLPALVFSLFTTLAAATPAGFQHGIAMHGDLKYPADFTHFEYTNPNAPHGGQMRRWALGTYDSFNPWITKGTPVDGVELLYDGLMVKASDEAFSQYGLLADGIKVADDRSWVEFHLNPDARFSDGQPVTAQDVIFTFETLRSKGNPFFKAYYADILEIKALSDNRVHFDLKPGNRELALIIGEVPILPEHYWAERDFSKPGLDIPVGSGPYTIDSFDAGRSITYKLREDYWGEELPVNQGRYNITEIRFDYYRDSAVALEAFKAGEYDFRQETSSKLWATGYTGPAFDSGTLVKQEIKHSNPTGMQAFIFNTRREKFSDPKVRQALAYAFDFEWTNKNIFYSAYNRTHSYFSNSEMAARELPTPAELEILEPVKDQVPAEVFSKVYKAPTTDGRGNNRRQLRTALRMLKQAGWSLHDGKLLNDKTGQPLSFEILLVQPAFERVVAPMQRNLERMGVDARIRIVDVSQYINLLRSHDFDMVVSGFGQSTSPGNEQREYWHSSTADLPGSRNLIGIKNPAVDYLVEQVIQAPDREQLILRTRALDRVLQWNHYVIPQYHISSYRIAYDSKFGMPEKHPKYSLGLDTWWVKESAR